MDILRLPPPLRRALLASPRAIPHLAHRTIATTPQSSPSEPLFQPHNSLPSSPTRPPGPLLTPSTLNSYQTTTPPTPTHLNYAHHFFTTTPPHILYSAATFRTLPPSPHPEIAFLGRSNVGKSSLLNTLFNRPNSPVAHVSKRPGRTRTMNGWGVSGGLQMGAAPREGEREAAWKRFPRGGCVVVDMPGYGGGSREEWGKEALKFLERRRQLRRTFVLVDAEHGLKGSDLKLLGHLRREGLSFQVVLSKVDKVVYPKGAKGMSPGRVEAGLGRLREVCGDVRERINQEAGDGRSHLMDILCASSEKGLDKANRHSRLGVDEVRWAVLSACGLECDDQGQRRSMSLLDDINVLEEDET
ncbi:hypothetical protein B0A50_00088 [Salinomyces thailandicus]|uniref:EngB-type G domain-containing protein n=1 Tax=Salinomyces thailandicus TaxID=706561 RepID=A0A4U0UEZ0_9PEZI|nr:hypothetical protein B0A50_00088 [Salinomyces thailandica]